MKRFALAVTVVVCLPLAGDALGAPTASPGKSACRPQPASAVPVPLTSSQCDQASHIVATDPYLRKLLAGAKYTVGRPDPWGGNGNHDLGAVLKIHLAKKLYVSRTEIPVADFSCDGCSKYVARHQAVSINGATGLTVFVDLGRHRVVWVMPTPLGSEGPPPTSVPPYTLPAGFTEGTAGATGADAAAGLVLHLAAFDQNGRLVEEEWFDPVTGQGVTDVYDSERKLASSMVSTLSGSKMTVTTISYLDRTSTTGSGPLPIGNSDFLVLDSRTVPARIQASGMTSVGSGTVDGLTADHLRGALVGIPYWGILFVAGGTGDMWVDPATSLPIEVSLDLGGKPEMKIYFSWLPRTSDVTAQTTLTTPAGYKDTPSSGLPHIFGS